MTSQTIETSSRIERLVHRLQGEGIGAAMSPEAIDAAARWLALLKEWNARMDLTAAKGDDDLVELMLADALVLGAHIADGVEVVDVGSGAGAPGLALAIARPDLRVTLVESLGKRVAFLRTVLGTLGRADVRLERAKGQALADNGEAWDVAISRATLPPPEWLALGARLVREGGSVWLLLAKEAPEGALAGAATSGDVPGLTVRETIVYSRALATGASGDDAPASRRALRFVRG